MATIGALIYKIGLDLAELVQNSAQVNTKLDSLAGMATKAGRALGALATVAAVRSVAEYADQIGDLATKASISTDAVQELGYAAKSTGGSMEAAINSVVFLSKGLAGGDKSVVDAVGQLGLKVADLRAMGSEKAFYAVADAIAAIPDPAAQSDIALSALGKTGRENLAMLRTGVSGLADEAHRFGQVMDKEAVRSGGNFADALDRLLTVGKTLLISVIAPFLPVLESLANVVAWLGGWFGKLVTIVWGVIDPFEKLAKGWSDLTVAWHHFRGEAEDVPAIVNRTKDGLTESAQANEKWRQSVAARAATPLGEALKAEQSLTESAKTSIERNTKSVEAWKEAVDRADKAAAEWAKTLEDATGVTAYNHMFEAMKVIEVAGNAIDPKKFTELAAQVAAGVEAANRLGLAVPSAAAQVAAGFVEAGTPIQNFLADLLKINATMEQMPFYAKNVKNLPMFMGLPAVPQGGDPNRFAGPSPSLGAGFLGKGGVIANQAGAIMKGQWSTVGSAVGSQLGTNVVSKFGSSITGLLGNTVGGLVNSFLPAIGSMLGPLITAITKLFDHSATNAQNAANAYGVKLSESLSKGIIDDSKGLFGGNFQAATIYNLSKLVDEAGGVTKESFAKWGKAANDIFSMVQTGAFTTAQAAKAFDPVFSKLAANLKETGGLADDQFRQLIGRVDEFHVKSAAVTTFVKESVTTATSGIVDYLGIVSGAHAAVLSGQQELADIQKRLAGEVTDTDRAELIKREEALKASLVTQQTLVQAVGLSSQTAASAFSDALWGMYDTLLKKGLSVTDALAQMGPAVTALEAELTRAGFSGGDAFAELQRMVALSSDELAGPALKAVQDMGSGLTALYNSGILNESMFTGMAGQIAHTFDTLVTAGKPADDVLRMMQPQLQTIWELWTKQGWAIDESTQKLLEEAEAQGLVGETHKSTQDQMLDGIGRIADATERLADIFGGRLPDAMVSGADAIVGQADRMGRALDAAVNVPRTAKIVVDYTDGMPGAPDGQPGGSYATGGVVSSARRATSGLRVPAWAPHFASGGEVPAILHTGEYVVSRRGVQAAGLAALSVFNQGGAPMRGGNGPSAVVVNQDGLREELANIRRLLRDFPRAVSIAVQDAQVLAPRRVTS